jgi:glycosyltransferase involved in cell wall biosynthesis
MNILFTLTYYAPHWTGLTEHAKRLAEGMVTRGHTVSVVTTKHDSSLSSHEEIAGVSVERTSVQFRLSRTLVSFSFVSTVIKHAKHADIVLLYTPLAEVFPLILLLKLIGKKTIIVHNGDLLLPPGFLNMFLEKIFDVSSYAAGSMTDHLISYSNDYGRYSRFLKYFLHKTTPIFPLFSKTTVDSLTTKSLRTKMPSHRTPIIGFAGRFVEEKGFDILLQAIPYVLETYPQALFVFAGEEHMVYEYFFEKHVSLIQKVQHSLYSFGLLHQKEMPSFYTLLDVFVLPSRSDCLAFVQVEAMKSGIPVVVSDIPGARVAVQMTGMGMLVEKEHPKKLAKSICDVYHTKQSRGYKTTSVDTVFDYNHTLDQYELLLQHIASDKK